ncbi:hypothetical protein BD324DRAFT_583712 [Kockovaella imperatae]|uniref:Glycosyltransferase family 32 protein n=1 Tax=Kockovaella imperatae TaxID=4999 RepID=A0A1Y1U7W0_9TREE|nr:hypothetical protein BD324DRAFT_583712 [Kockovaella imperatae]ORX34120.1 hypothetical protein BD324DRAFT_583712 [Kockovaella imperatae]
MSGLTNSIGHSTVLNIGEVTSPLHASNGFNTQPPPYPEATSSAYANAGYPRSRRKSLSHINPNGITRPDPETSPDESYHVNGQTVTLGPHSKGKKKRSRTASFSLPFHRRRRLSNAGWSRWLRFYAAHYLSTRWGQITTLLTFFLFAIFLWRRYYELQLEVSVFSHRWVRTEVDSVSPLRGCFNPPHLSPSYNIQRHNAPNQHILTPGVSLKRGTQCYDFSATIQSSPDIPLEPLIYHTYWRSDLIPFGERHTATLLAFLATQPLTHSKLILWTNGVDVVANNSFVKPFLEKWGRYIEVRAVDMGVLTRGTELEGILSGNDGGGLFDQRAWVDGDAVRLLVLWHYGGIWMDMDQILTRDLHPLTDQEFVTQWDCYDKPYFALNGALMHFRQHSPYLCEAFHIMASSPLPKPNTFTWGSHLYSKLHRRLLANHQKPFAVLPWCFADPRNCRADIRFPDPFGPDPEYWGGRRWDGRGEVGRSGREMFEEKVGYVFTIHLHNQWKKDFTKNGWVSKLLEGYQRTVDSIERHGRTIIRVGTEGDVGEVE